MFFFTRYLLNELFFVINRQAYEQQTKKKKKKRKKVGSRLTFDEKEREEQLAAHQMR